MHFNFSLPKTDDIFMKNDSYGFIRFHDRNHLSSLYSAYFSTRDYKHVFLFECVACLGLFVALCGYRFLKLAMFSSGFFLAFAAFYVISPRFIKTKYCCTNHGNEEVHIASSALFGTIIGLIVSRMYRIGVFFIGKSLGLLMAMVLLQTPFGKYFQSNASVAVLFTLSAIIFGSLSTKFEKSLVICSTSVLGSYVALCGIDVFLKSSFSFAVFGFIIYFKEIIQAGIHSKWHLQSASLPHLQLTITWLEKESLSMLGCWLGLSVICCLVQFKVTAKDLEQGGYVCPFNFQACICGCCQGKDGKESSSKQEETVYLFTNGDKYDLREGRKR